MLINWEGILKSVWYRIHELIVFGLDINNIMPEITVERDVKYGYNLDHLAEGQCIGREAWIEGDTLSTCLCVDRKSLLFQKMSVVLHSKVQLKNSEKMQSPETCRSGNKHNEFLL